MRPLSKVYTALIFVILYAPIAVMVLFSFNSINSTGVFAGFSTYWYRELLRDGATLAALKNTLVLAVSSSLVATVIGTVAAVGIFKLKSRAAKSAIMTVTNIPMMNPDIVTGISMMLLFVFVCVKLAGAASLSFATVLVAHITFNLPYVILSVMPKLGQLDPNLRDAALDLGCTPVQAFFKVIIHEILPGILSGALMAFTMSLDDFVISYFVYGPGFVTLPVEIYNYTKKPLQPKIYALFTLLFLAILLVMVVMNLLQAGDDRRRRQARGVFKKKGANA